MPSPRTFNIGHNNPPPDDEPITPELDPDDPCYYLLRNCTTLGPSPWFRLPGRVRGFHVVMEGGSAKVSLQVSYDRKHIGTLRWSTHDDLYTNHEGWPLVRMYVHSHDAGTPRVTVMAHSAEESK